MIILNGLLFVSNLGKLPYKPIIVQKGNINPIDNLISIDIYFEHCKRPITASLFKSLIRQWMFMYI